MTMRHAADNILDLKLSDEVEPIGVTATHRIYSEDRSDFARASELRIGERLRTYTYKATVESIGCRHQNEMVYNLEVEAEHLYYVSPLRVLVHNDCPTAISGETGPFYRGGTSMQPKPGELKITPDNMVQPTKGLSVNTSAAKVEKFGGAHEVGDIPASLKIQQRGADAGHFEIMPKAAMPLPDYLKAVNSISLSPKN